MSGFNGISERIEQSTEVLGQLAVLRLQLDRLANLNAPVTTDVRVQLHLALDHVDDAITRHEKWLQSREVIENNCSPSIWRYVHKVRLSVGMVSMATKPVKRRLSVCQDCGKKCYVEMHHEPPQSEGGTQTIPLCRRCHVARHCAANHWAMWGQRGGRQTARTPMYWMRNLKQFRADPSLRWFWQWEQERNSRYVETT